jgi:hypothetical protein
VVIFGITAQHIVWIQASNHFASAQQAQRVTLLVPFLVKIPKKKDHNEIDPFRLPEPQPNRTDQSA